MEGLMVQSEIASAEDASYEDVYPLRDFTQDPSSFLEKIGSTHSHITLTINGTPAAIVLDPAEYRRLLDLAADADVVEGIRQGTEDVLAGRTKSVDKVFSQLLGKHGVQG
jgi:PHD/YefM family antitoxin component YafN of YafNO toxin-antitoxin module